MAVRQRSFDPESEHAQAFYAALLALQDVDECALFFHDLCTPNEQAVLAGRWEVARFLAAGMPYREITARTGSSSRTIGRARRWLESEAGGFRMILERMDRRIVNTESAAVCHDGLGRDAREGMNAPD